MPQGASHFWWRHSSCADRREGCVCIDYRYFCRCPFLICYQEESGLLGCRRASLRLFQGFCVLSALVPWYPRLPQYGLISVCLHLPLGRCVYLHLFHVADSTDHVMNRVGLGDCLHYLGHFLSRLTVSPIFTPIDCAYAGNWALSRWHYPTLSIESLMRSCAVWWRRINPFAVDCDIFVLPSPCKRHCKDLHCAWYFC